MATLVKNNKPIDTMFIDEVAVKRLYLLSYSISVRIL